MMQEPHRDRLFASIKPVTPAQPVLTLKWRTSGKCRSLTTDTTHPQKDANG